MDLSPHSKAAVKSEPSVMQLAATERRLSAHAFHRTSYEEALSAGRSRIHGEGDRKSAYAVGFLVEMERVWLCCQ